MQIDLQQHEYKMKIFLSKSAAAKSRAGIPFMSAVRLLERLCNSAFRFLQSSSCFSR
jgi:hypothetical protein